jgi:hypothetical protein
MLMVGLTGCALNVPFYGKIGTKTKHIVVYTDADVEINKGIVESDDTTIMIVSFGKTSDEKVVESMKEIREIFRIRGDVYKA